MEDEFAAEGGGLEDDEDEEEEGGAGAGGHRGAGAGPRRPSGKPKSGKPKAKAAARAAKRAGTAATTRAAAAAAAAAQAGLGGANAPVLLPIVASQPVAHSEPPALAEFNLVADMCGDWAHRYSLLLVADAGTAYTDWTSFKLKSASLYFEAPVLAMPPLPKQAAAAQPVAAGAAVAKGKDAAGKGIPTAAAPATAPVGKAARGKGAAAVGAKASDAAPAPSPSSAAGGGRRGKRGASTEPESVAASAAVSSSARGRSRGAAADSGGEAAAASLRAGTASSGAALASVAAPAVASPSKPAVVDGAGGQLFLRLGGPATPLVPLPAYAAHGRVLPLRYELCREPGALSADGFDVYRWSAVVEPMALPAAAMLRQAVPLTPWAPPAAAAGVASAASTVLSPGRLLRVMSDGATAVGGVVPLHSGLDWNELVWSAGGVTIRGAFYPLRSLRTFANQVFQRPAGAPVHMVHAAPGLAGLVGTPAVAVAVNGGAGGSKP
jgi:hypothetical protein